MTHIFSECELNERSKMMYMALLTKLMNTERDNKI